MVGKLESNAKLNSKVKVEVEVEVGVELGKIGFMNTGRHLVKDKNHMYVLSYQTEGYFCLTFGTHL